MPPGLAWQSCDGVEFDGWVCLLRSEPNEAAWAAPAPAVIATTVAVRVSRAARMPRRWARAGAAGAVWGWSGVFMWIVFLSSRLSGGGVAPV